jgi:thioredoxin reductase (NADPH)
MIRERISRFAAYTGAAAAIRRSFLGAAGVALSFSFLKDPLATVKHYDHLYDLAVIGGGSGGLATAFEANKHGLNVIVIDFVEESLHKTKWGLGGTCVNVGCIPKKLMHQAAKYKEEIINANDYGWELGVNDREKEEELGAVFSWEKLRGKIQSYIKSINFGYVSAVNRLDEMDYLNCLATFKDKNTIICSKNPKIIHEFVKTGQLPELDKNNPTYF